MNDQQWLTVADAAKDLKVTTRQVHRYAEHGQLVTRRAGQRVLFSAASVAQLADDLAVDMSGKETTLPPSPPLRTVRAAFTAYRSSLSNALLRTRFHNR